MAWPHARAAVTVALLAVSLAPGPTTAQRTLHFRNFQSRLLVRPDGSVLVTENIRVRFEGSWNGLLRAIPVEYATGYGANYTLRVDMLSARDDAGNDLRWESEREGRNRVFRVWVPGAHDAEHTVVLQYRVRNALRFFDEHDELYWNVTGDESEFAIQSAGAEVVLPAGATGIRASAFTGAYGSRQTDARVAQSGSVVAFHTSRPLGFREGLTVVVGWDPGLIPRPGTADRVRAFLYSNSVLLTPLLALGVMLQLWRRRGRDPRLRPIAPQYEPPAGLTPAEVGTLVDASADLRDITATIVDLAVRGFLRIEEVREEKAFGLFTSQDYRFTAVQPRGTWEALKPHERKLLGAVFRGGADTVRASELENEFYRDLPAITRDLRETLVTDGHYLHHPNTVRGVFIALGLVVGGLVGALGSVFLAQVLGQQPAAAVVAGGLTAAVIISFGMVMPARTERGTRTLEALLGFEEFLRRVEGDRFERVIRTPEMFEKYLPYAMALGVEKNWSRAFEDIYSAEPAWYRGSGADGFRSHIFASNLSRMASFTGSAMQKAPRSSSSSSGFGGGGGGGFSGGGFGGGRVGGF